jgi:D-alanyl-lipoteichoic acid acyltransferase DltB (MBOAT superfamily)
MTYRNLFLTMLLGGLWHGAAWNFVIWGAFHGAGLGAERVIRRRFGERLRLPRWLGVILTFHAVCFLWVFFRAETFEAAVAVLTQVGAGVGGLTNVTRNVAIVMALGFVGHFLPERWWERLLREFVRAPAPLQAAAAIATLYLARVAAESGAAPFIYFQF